MQLSVEEITQLMETSERLKIELEAANNKLAVAQAERKDLYEVGIGVMGFMGVLEPGTRRLRPEIESKEDSPFPFILKALGSLTGLMLKAQGPAFMGSKNAADELEQKFSFIKKLIEIVQKYGNDPATGEGGN